MRISKRWTLLLAASALALITSTSAVGAAGSQTYTVGSLTVPGVDTGVVLKQGKPVTVTATGEFCPGTGYCAGPDGSGSWNSLDTTYGGFTLPGAPVYGLLARVGSAPWVHVGSGPTTLAGEGPLVFAVNDDLYIDNAGGFTVTVTGCYPGWGNGDDKHEHCGPPGRSDKP